MCNLYTVRKSIAEVAAFFGATAPAAPFNTPDESYPGSPGMVVREAEGERVVRHDVGLPGPTPEHEARL
jgi:putative SOS response-associated peptidase YedK